jgi:DNA-binding beta-propeller fold protein YncE
MHMRTRKLILVVLAVALPGGYAVAKSIARFSVPEFALIGRPIGGAQVAAPTPPHLTGSRIMAVDEAALVIDADSGALIKTDRAGKNIGQVAIARDAGLMTLDPIAGVAYVADRRNDRIAVVEVDEMAIASTIRTPAEPYAVALTPDRKKLLVSTIADRTLVAYDVASGGELWRTSTGAEPRGLAISPDGSRALISYLTTGTVDEFNLDAGMHRAAPIAIASAAVPRRCRRCGNDGDSFARAAFAVTFMGDRQAVVPFQREVPVQTTTEASARTSSYGGGVESPITHQVAFLGFEDGRIDQTTAAIAQHQPRAIAWDRAHDALYIAGMGSDSIVQIRNASQASIGFGSVMALGPERERCGPDGLAITPSGHVLVWCSFTRTVQRVAAIDGEGGFASVAAVTNGPQLVASALTAKQHKGFVLFHAAEPRTSQGGSMACSSCHPDQRADGLSWRIDKHQLQTPILAGRVVGTHPYKWDGTDATLRDSLTSTMKRLGGTGLSRSETDAMAAYLESLPTVRTPRRDVEQVARGKQLFASEGCTGCHAGASYTDRERHKFSGTLQESDTPSLRGLAASAPYYHDGSAVTLEVLLRDRGAVHGMADTSRLTEQQLADLSAFLETL